MGGYSSKVVFILLILSCMAVQSTNGHLIKSYYEVTCPNVEKIVEKVLKKAVTGDPRSAASLVRMFFHDCFVMGCDASVLLDNSTSFISEQEARPNNKSLRGFSIIEDIKSAVEKECSETVSCADILALAARDSVVQAGGPYYDVLLGRRDSKIANYTAANSFLPAPTLNVSTLKDKFVAVGLTMEDMVTLSGAHTMGKVQCSSITKRLYNQSGSGKPDPALPTNMLSMLQEECPNNDPKYNNKTLFLDPVTPEIFDNQYFKNLLARRGILYSDQVMADTEGSTMELIKLYARDQNLFFQAFVKSMTKMGSINP